MKRQTLEWALFFGGVATTMFGGGESISNFSEANEIFYRHPEVRGISAGYEAMPKDPGIQLMVKRYEEGNRSGSYFGDLAIAGVLSVLGAVYLFGLDIDDDIKEGEKQSRDNEDAPSIKMLMSPGTISQISREPPIPRLGYEP